MISGKQLKAGTVTAAKCAADVVVASGANPLTADWSVGNFKLRALADPTADTDAATQGFVLKQVITGRSFRELVLIPEQLNVLGLLPATAIRINTIPSINDTFVLKDGTTTETFTFKAARAGAFEVTIGGSLDATVENLGMAVGTDSAVWSSAQASGLDRYFAGAPSTGLGVFYRKTIGTNADRIYGSQTVPSGIKVLQFTSTAGSDYDPSGATEANIPAADPGAGRWGIARGATSLRQNETHLVANTNAVWTWDGDDQVWRQTDIGSLAFAAPSVTVRSDASGASAGSAATALRSDMQIIASTATAVDASTTSAQGSSTSLARANHTHNTPRPSKVNKGLTALVTVADGDAATATAMAAPGPGLGSWVDVRVNGIGYNVGDGVKTTACYFSGDGGTTARAMNAIVTGDTLRWNGSIAGFQLAVTDRVDMLFEAFS